MQLSAVAQLGLTLRRSLTCELAAKLMRANWPSPARLLRLESYGE